MKIAESLPNRKKSLWEKEQLLVMSNFSFSHSVFKSHIQQTHKNQGLFGKGSIRKNTNADEADDPGCKYETKYIVDTGIQVAQAFSGRLGRITPSLKAILIEMVRDVLHNGHRC